MNFHFGFCCDLKNQKPNIHAYIGIVECKWLTIFRFYVLYLRIRTVCQIVNFKCALKSTHVGLSNVLLTLKINLLFSNLVALPADLKNRVTECLPHVCSFGIKWLIFVQFSVLHHRNATACQISTIDSALQSA